MDGRTERQLTVYQNCDQLVASLPEVVKQYYNNMRTNLQPLTVYTYISVVHAYLYFVSDKPKNMSKKELVAHVAEFLNSKTTIERTDKDGNITCRQASFSYRQKLYAGLKHFFDYLYKSQYIRENPMLLIDKPRGKDKIKRYEVTANDLQLILRAVQTCPYACTQLKYGDSWKQRDRVMLLFFMQTGMRCGALTELNLTSLDLEHGLLHVVDKGSKENEYNIQHILPDIEAWLQDRQQIMNAEHWNCDALFISGQGKRLSPLSVVHLVRKYTEAGIGKALSPHKLRAAFCTNLYNVTHDIEFVRRAVGHSSVSTTQRYIVTDDAEIKTQSADIMASQLGLG